MAGARAARREITSRWQPGIIVRDEPAVMPRLIALRKPWMLASVAFRACVAVLGRAARLSASREIASHGPLRRFRCLFDTLSALHRAIGNGALFDT